MSRLVPALGRPAWLADFGGGFGRNAVHYRHLARRYVLVDYSTTNLANAARGLSRDVADGRAFLVRADLNRLPFVTGAFDAAMMVRVLHHLPDVDGALAEMGRTIDGRWLLDVPIKHHVLALARAAGKRQLRSARDDRPVSTGVTDTPFWNFKLAAVRRTLRDEGWQTTLAASVNNLRRWDRSLPPRVVRALTPAARMVEAASQPIGRGWWGPSQFVVAERTAPLPVPESVVHRPGAEGVDRNAPACADRMVCPDCHGVLVWTDANAQYRTCRVGYHRDGAVWDFVNAVR